MSNRPKPDHDPTPVTADDLDDTLASLKRRAQAEFAALSRLPCYPFDPVYQEGRQGASLPAAIRACDDASAEPTCPASRDEGCPKRREEREAHDRRGAFAANLKKAGVLDREQEVLAAIGTPALKRTAPMAEALRLAHLHRRKALVVFNGDKGQGKSVAACYLIGRFGGLYTKAAHVLRKGFDLAEAERVPVLVIDQFGRENLGDGDWALGKIEDLLDTRYAARLLTVLCANIDRSIFDERYGEIVADRLRGDGEWHDFKGPSYRGAA